MVHTLFRYIHWLFPHWQFRFYNPVLDIIYKFRRVHKLCIVLRKISQSNIERTYRLMCLTRRLPVKNINIKSIMYYYFRWYKNINLRKICSGTFDENILCFRWYFWMISIDYRRKRKDHIITVFYHRINRTIFDYIQIMFELCVVL